jgi:hypothetical protein
VISSSFCVDSNYDGCVPNDDITLPFVASVSQTEMAAPEPSAAWPLGAVFAALAGRKLRARGRGCSPQRSETR